jgi:hypothetical protein
VPARDANSFIKLLHALVAIPKRVRERARGYFGGDGGRNDVCEGMYTIYS